jgi:PAS domain S-box-containing protein
MLIDPEIQLSLRRFYEDILNFIPAGIAVLDTRQRYLFLNPVAVSDPEVRNWLIGKTDDEYFKMRGKNTSIPSRRKQLFSELMLTKKEVEWEEELINKKGVKEIHLRKMYPVLDEEGNVKMVIGYGLDISERKNIEEQVKLSEKRYRDLFNYSKALICTHDLDGRILTVNPAILQILQYKETEMVGRNISEFVPIEAQPYFKAEYIDIIVKNGKAQGVFSVISRYGKKIYLLYQNYKVEEPGAEPYIIGFSQDITQRVLAEQELLHAQKITEEIHKAKETFLANMSHEIRTPMNGILGIAGLLAKTPLNLQQKNYLQLIQDSANHLLVIVNDILDLEKIGAGKIQLEEIPFNVSEKIINVIQSFTFKAEEKELQLIYKNQLQPNLHAVGDPFRLSQILNNVLSNAIKFTESGSIIITTSVKFDKEDWAAIEFVVKDTGIGIPKDKLRLIFEPFIQANADTTRKYGGTGLGLSISKNLIEMQGGEVWVESEPGEGTTFRFIVPYRKCNDVAIQPETPPSYNYKSLTGCKALVAEDVELNQFLARHIMESWGVEVVIAENGRKAVDALKQNHFDFILMDIQMPEMDGIQATQHIRRLPDESKAGIPIIALTANALKGDSEKYISSGMNDYLSKPFTEQQLFTVINRNLKLSVMNSNVNDEAPQEPAGENNNGQTRLYDLTLIRSVSGGDEGFIKKMVQLFVETVPATLNDLQQALQDQQWEKLGKVAHKLKSTIDSMDISSLKDDIRTIESSGKHQQNTDALPPLVQKVRDVSFACIEELKIDFPL